MEDAQEFGWAPPKGAHALFLCRMEEGKVNWSMTDKMYRLRRVYVQNVFTNSANTQERKNEKNGT